MKTTFKKAAQLAVVSAAISTGHAQVLPLGSISLAPSTIVDSPQWRQARQQVQDAQQRLAKRPLVCVAGVITEPAYLN